MIKGAGVIFISMIGLMIGYLAQLGLMIGPMSGDWEAGLGCQRLESRRPETGRPDLGVRGGLGCERLETRTLGMTQYLMLRHNVFGALPISTSRK